MATVPCTSGNYLLHLENISYLSSAPTWTWTVTSGTLPQAGTLTGGTLQQPTCVPTTAVEAWGWTTVVDVDNLRAQVRRELLDEVRAELLAEFTRLPAVPAARAIRLRD